MRQKHSTGILNVAYWFASRESAFLLAVVGVIVQSFHTYFITYSLSSYDGFLKIFQALLMAFFLSGALLYFTLKSSDEDTKRAKRYRKLVITFAVLESLINLWYWGHKLLIEMWPNPDYGSFIICIPFSIFLPFILKNYSTEVRVDDFTNDNDIESAPDDTPKEILYNDSSSENFNKIMDELYSEEIKEARDRMDKIIEDKNEIEIESKESSIISNLKTSATPIIKATDNSNIIVGPISQVSDNSIIEDIESEDIESEDIESEVIESEDIEPYEYVDTIDDNYIIASGMVIGEFDESHEDIEYSDKDIEAIAKNIDLELLPTEDKNPTMIDEVFDYEQEININPKIESKTIDSNINPIQQPSDANQTINGVRKGTVNYYSDTKNKQPINPLYDYGN